MVLYPPASYLGIQRPPQPAPKVHFLSYFYWSPWNILHFSNFSFLYFFKCLWNILFPKCVMPLPSSLLTLFNSYYHPTLPAPPQHTTHSHTKPRFFFFWSISGLNNLMPLSSKISPVKPSIYKIPCYMCVTLYFCLI